MLARTAATKVVARQQNLRRFGFRSVQNEIGLWAALGVVAPIVEQLVAQSFLRNCFQESRRDDLVGIDVIDCDCDQPAFKWCKSLHCISSLTSVTTPVTAAAAAVRGLARNVRPPLPWRPSKFRLLVETLYSPGCN